MPRALIDTTVLFAAAYRRDAAHDDALPVLRGIDDGSLPEAVVLDYGNVRRKARASARG